MFITLKHKNGGEGLKDEGSENLQKTILFFSLLLLTISAKKFCGRRVDCLNLVIERLSGNINLDRCKDFK